MTTPPPLDALLEALLEEATRRSGVVWLALDDAPTRVVWHLWQDGALWTVCGAGEQPLPGAGTATRAVVTVRSKATQNDRLLTWVGSVEQVVPGSEVWEAIVPALHETRLNALDGEEQPQRWARECLVLKVTPTGELLDVR